MVNKWVDRDGSNNIIGLYANEQFPGQEKLTDTDPEVINFLNPPYAVDVTTARMRKYQELKKEAAKLWIEYRDSDITLTDTDINNYDVCLYYIYRR